ncbi:hypothetical protein ACTFIR_000120 [Dictyostelium discoideum]
MSVLIFNKKLFIYDILVILILILIVLTLVKSDNSNDSLNKSINENNEIKENQNLIINEEVESQIQIIKENQINYSFHYVSFVQMITLSIMLICGLIPFEDFKKNNNNKNNNKNKKNKNIIS